MNFFSLKSSPRVLVHEACGGAVRVLDAPSARGWRSGEERRSGNGFSMMVLKYVFATLPVPLVLSAKVYAVDAQSAPLPKPEATDWREAFGGLFSSFALVDARRVQQRTLRETIGAAEGILEGMSAQLEVPVRIRERRSVIAREQFVVTATGTPKDFADRAGEIEKWFASVTFVPAAARV